MDETTQPEAVIDPSFAECLELYSNRIGVLHISDLVEAAISFNVSPANLYKAWKIHRNEYGVTARLVFEGILEMQDRWLDVYRSRENKFEKWLTMN